MTTFSVHVHSHDLDSDKPSEASVPMGGDDLTLALTLDAEQSLTVDFTGPSRSEHRLRDLYLAMRDLIDIVKSASDDEDERQQIARPTVYVDGEQQN